MSRKRITWFGINLSQKQATQVFILSFAGVFLLAMISIPMISSFIMSLRNAIIHDDLDWWLEYALWYNVPYMCIMLFFLAITLHSLLKSRRVAQSYSDTIEPQNNEPRTLMYCPNCGNKRTVIEKFCRACGEEFR